MKSKSDNLKRIITVFNLLVIIIAFYAIYLNSTSVEEINNISIHMDSPLQNKNQTSYFLTLTPDNFGNFRISADVYGYNHNHSKILSIVRHEAEQPIDNVYEQFKPALVYLYYSNKMYSITSNFDEAASTSGTINYDVEADEFEVQNVELSEQRYNVKLPKIAENISDFSLLIYTKDTQSVSSLNLYPFDSITSIVVLDFPNKSNVNLLVDIPSELDSYAIKTYILEENKETGNTSPAMFKEIYNNLYYIHSTQSINHSENYTRIEVEMKRHLYSIEVISYLAIILIAILIKIRFLFEYPNMISIYSLIFTVAFWFYTTNRPSIGITSLEIITIASIALLCSPTLFQYIRSRLSVK